MESVLNSPDAPAGVAQYNRADSQCQRSVLPIKMPPLAEWRHYARNQASAALLVELLTDISFGLVGSPFGA